MNAFHYAFKVKDIKSTRRFYVDILEFEEGTSTESWIDFNFLAINYLRILVLVCTLNEF
ncbi:MULTISPECIES: hypothetical protein [unclassified Kaistella]|uniref:hypothetical protein n=1 Tax=unclassified Kaistella TaxID=2762626 RepID=UPI002732E90C|nr:MULTISPECIES: hypothetical protein [unclassified Kaistella]MDP2453904.1 hypothetical protein [Kaistella sp. SH11-4b]MDP2456961.1 hypothetical protein [Kaistella sp. SH40-3]MDP2459718.1 hypothetical protein [Kaistella sp. SH19-2b]